MISRTAFGVWLGGLLLALLLTGGGPTAAQTAPPPIFMPIIQQPLPPPVWEMTNTVGGDLIVTLEGVGGHTFPPGVTAWRLDVPDGVYAYSLVVSGGRCNGLADSGTVLLGRGIVAKSSYECIPRPDSRAAAADYQLVKTSD